MRARFGAIERSDLPKHIPHLLLQIAELHKVSLSLDRFNVIHLQYAVGMRPINGSWVEVLEQVQELNVILNRAVMAET